MRNAILTLGVFVFCLGAKAQIDAGSVMGMPSGTTAQITNITTASIGSCAFSTDEGTIYWYTSTGWVNSSDDQDASEVDLTTSVDVNGDATDETTVEEVVQSIAPITSASGRIFYPPSIAIDASTTGNNRTIDLYQQYLDQYDGSGSNYTASTGAPAIPTYGPTDLYYYVTYADPAVFNIDSIDDNGNMQYDIIGAPVDYNSLINVVFVVK